LRGTRIAPPAPDRLCLSIHKRDQFVPEIQGKVKAGPVSPIGVPPVFSVSFPRQKFRTAHWSTWALIGARIAAYPRISAVDIARSGAQHGLSFYLQIAGLENWNVLTASLYRTQEVGGANPPSSTLFPANGHLHSLHLLPRAPSGKKCQIAAEADSTYARIYADYRFPNGLDDGT
jgi:hypothetical protein